jgi:UDP-N-acetylmuramate dehydrogenase
MRMAEHQHLANPALRGRLLHAEPMKKHVSWRAGGAAAQAYLPADVEDLCVFLKSLPPREPVCFAGLGSNLLVRDGGFAGTVVLMHDTNAAIRLEPQEDGGAGLTIYADAGAASPKLARFAAMHAFAGAEFLAGIPGTVGGALAMNAGCYGGETWDKVERVLMVTRAGELVARLPADFDIGYRHVALKTGELGAAEWFAGGWFRFDAGDGALARTRIRELLQQRIDSQPLELPNAGSVFRNPPGDHAARLIEASGLKGCAIGGASVSDKHANFIVNPKGRASAADIEALIEHVRATVLAKQGVALDPEVRIIGDRAEAAR